VISSPGSRHNQGMQRVRLALLSLGVCLAGCEPRAPSDESAEETGDGDGDPGDGDGDGDGKPGDGDGDSGDGDGDSGDGDGDPFEGWCDICVDPPDYAGCGVVEGPEQSVRFSVPGEHFFDLDESCTVTSVSPTFVSFDCETLDPEIDIDLVEPWVPTLELGETVHVVASFYEMDLWGSNADWRVDRADNTLALAGLQDFGGFSSIGLGAVPVTWVTDACALECGGDTAFQEFGVAFDVEGEQGTVFGGGHATVGGLEVWVPEARRLVCEYFSQYSYGYSNVFISAG
jgi:hypothetical protein